MLRHHHVGALFCKAPNSPLSSLRRRRWVLLCNTSLTFPRSSRRDPSVHNKMALWGFGKKDKKPTASLQTRGRPWLNSRSRGARLWDDVTDSREITTPPTCRAHNWAVGMGSSGGGGVGWWWWCGALQGCGEEGAPEAVPAPGCCCGSSALSPHWPSSCVC